MKTNLFQRLSNIATGQRSCFWLAAMLIVFAFALSPREARAASASPGDYMTYQGFLVDATGTPLATNLPANYPVVFRIYTNSTTPTPLWTEQQVVTVDRGQFSVVLGEGASYNAEPRPALSTIFTNATASDRYIGITVTIGAITTDILPRLRLVPSPYAFLASSANKLLNVTNGAAYVNFNGTSNRTEVAGNLYASGVISGNGSGLTGLTAAQIPALSAANITSGTLADARLSANVALRAGGNAFTGSQTISSGNLGLGVSPTYPITFGATYGDKISLFGGASLHYGLGLQPGLLQLHSDGVGTDIAFGYGSSSSFTELMRIKGNGNVGIGTNNPTAKLVVAGNLNVTGQLTVGTDNLTSVSASEVLRIVRGRISANGTNIVAGLGFTTTRLGVGVYRVDMQNTFSAIPAVTVNALNEQLATAETRVDLGGGGTIASCEFRFRRFDPGAGNFVPFDTEFNFIAVGPR